MRLKGKGGATPVLTRLILLLWKNWLVRRRRIWSLIWEFVGLALVVGVCFTIWGLERRTDDDYWYGEEGEDYFGEDGFHRQPHDQEIYQEQDLQQLVSPLFTTNTYAPIAYAPNTGMAEEVMTRVKAEYYDRSPTDWEGNKTLREWMGFADEEQLMAWHTQLALQQWNSWGPWSTSKGKDKDKQGPRSRSRSERQDGGEDYQQPMWMAVIIDASEKKTDWSYKLRMVEERWGGWGNVFEQGLYPEGNPVGSGSSFSRYVYAGFIGMQILMDQVMTQKLTGAENFTHQISLEMMPYPAYTSYWAQWDGIQELAQYFLPPFILMPCLVTFVLTIKWIIEEKESGFKELLKINGMANWMHWVGWMMNSMISFLIIAIVLSIVMSTTGFLNGTQGYLFFFVLFFFGLSLTSFSFFISSLFQRPSVGAWLGFLIWIVTLGAVAGVVESRGYGKLSDGDKYASCLVPAGAIWVAAKIITATKSAPDEVLNESFNLGHVILMLAVTAVGYTILALYFENIIPSKFGSRRPFYYPISSLLALCKGGNGQKEDVNIGVDGGNDGNGGKFEPEPPGLENGVSIKKLTKVYLGKRVVDQVSLNIYKGQITVLLGHNGAGKTTLIGMLTGITQPSGGTASINNHDIIGNLMGARENLSVCPQENRLLGKLTVADHLQLFGKLKGLSTTDARERSRQLAQQMGLSEKLNVATDQLSGGQKRKVQLGMSIIGNTQVVFLDEPSSGIDPESRRHIWDLIAEFRKDRAIVLTTHHMEEADVLGDRIAIMASGKIKCCGSTAYLKKLYGQGYTLRLTISEKGSQSNFGQGRQEEPPAKTQEIISLLQNHVAGSRLVKFHRDVDKQECQLDINIPIVREDNSNVEITARFPGLFAHLEGRKRELSIISMGLAYTNMDDVFQKVSEDENKSREEEVLDKNHRNGNAGLNGFSHEQRGQVPMAGKKSPAVSLFFRRLQALVVKKLLIMINSRGLLACQVLLTVIMFVAALVIMGEVYPPPSDDSFDPMSIRLSVYSDPITKFTSSDPSLSKAFETAVKGTGGGSPESFAGNLTMEYLEIGTKDIDTYLNRLVVGATLNATHLKGHFCRAPFHSEPLAINLLTNTMLAKTAADEGAGKSYSISVVNHPVKSIYEKTEKAVAIAQLYEFAKKSTTLLEFPDADGPISDFILSFLFAVLAYFGLAILAASFVVLPVEEKLNKAKQIQRMAGAGPVTYFLSFLICDLGLVLLLSGVLVALVPIINACGYTLPYADNDGLGVLYLIFVVFGVNVIGLSYLFSLRASSPAGGFIFLMLFHCFAVPVFMFLLAIIGLVLGLTGLGEAAVDLLDVGSKIALVFPSSTVINSLQRFGVLSLANTACEQLSPEMLKLVCESPSGEDDQIITLFSMCCPSCTKDCFETLPFFKGMATNSIGFFMLLLALEALIFAALLLWGESGFMGLDKLFHKGVEMVAGPSNFLSTRDSDVKEEAQRVDQALTSRDRQTDALYASHFCKSYKNFLAVSDLSFGVHYGECFGLLGVNGAGKTTMFKMLTGDEIPSSGDAVLEGQYGLAKDRQKFLGKIGFCPQFDAILGALTGRQMLSLICQLRGVYQKSVKDETQQWLVKMGLDKSGDVPCGNYSGGMKRRLSAAMALIGNPPVVLLDEPSTGVDPHARRQFWKILSAVQNSGQAIILTSHSMDECEVLCNRLAVMVNGQMQCFGSVEHLKQKFAQGYTITITLKGHTQVQSSGSAAYSAPDLAHTSPLQVVGGSNLSPNPGQSKVKGMMKLKFPQCELKDEHQNILQYQLKDTTMTWTRIFGNMERIKEEDAGLIEEYSVSDTTLEQIFLSFARQQYPEREDPAATCCRKCFLCCGLG